MGKEGMENSQRNITSHPSPPVETTDEPPSPPPQTPKRPAYSFVVGFGVPEHPQHHFDAESLTQRLTVFARCLDFAMRSHNVSAELVVVEWAPKEANASLLQFVDWQKLGLHWLTMVRIIQVPPETTKLAPPCRTRLQPPIDAPPGPTCFEFVAKNVGARRANGKFLVLFNIDDILTPQLGALFAKPDFFQERVFYRATRASLKSSLPAEHPSSKELYKMALSQHEWTPATDPGAITGPITPTGLRHIVSMSDLYSGDFLLLSKEDFFDVGGYPEIGPCVSKFALMHANYPLKFDSA